MTAKRICPTCGKQTLEFFAKKNEYRCTNTECGEIVAAPELHPSSSFDLSELPSFVAIPISQWFAEREPVLRLWRISDAVEILLRYAFVVALQELRYRHGGTLPPDVARWLRDHIGKPTYRLWLELLGRLHDEHGKSLIKPCASLSLEAQDNIRTHLFPLIGSNEGDPESHLLPLRNLLAHGGGMSRDAARTLLNECGHEARAISAMQAQLGWLCGHVPVFVRAPGDYLALRGVKAALLLGRTLYPGIESALDSRVDKVVFVSSERVMELSPFCRYDVPEATRFGSFRRIAEPRLPEIYIRSQSATLFYNALGADIPTSERGGDTFARFWEFFPKPAEEPDSKGHVGPITDGGFELELQADADGMIGRRDELASVMREVLAQRGRILWLGGPAGSGKSTLVAAMARNPHIVSQRHVLIVPFRFKSGDARCSRGAFLRLAIERLEKWPELPPAGKDEAAIPPVGSLDDVKLEDCLAALLRRIADAPPRRQAPRVLFLLDGLDEIAQFDPAFLELPRRHVYGNILWFCAGRPEPIPSKAFVGRDDVRALFADNPSHLSGMPPMSAKDVREMVLEGVAGLRYEILQADREDASVVKNEIIEAICHRADGLPIYVKLAIDDILRGHIRVPKALDDLPPSLQAYYEVILTRYGIDDLHQVLTPLVATLAVAYEPLDERALHALLSFRTFVADDAEGLRLLRQALEIAATVLRRAPTPEAGTGFMPYHESFREHVAIHSNRMRQAITTARYSLAEAAAKQWTKPELAPLRPYLFRSGIRHLVESGRGGAALALLTSCDYLVARIEESGENSVIALRADFALLPEADRVGAYVEWRDLFNRFGHLIARGGVQTLLERAVAMADTSVVTIAAERWMAESAWDKPWFRRARRPKDPPRDPCLRTLEGHTRSISSVMIHPDGRRVVSASADGTLMVWRIEAGACLRTLRGHTGSIVGAALSKDGARLLSAGSDNTLRQWDFESGQCLHKWDAPGPIVHFSATPDGTRALVADKYGALYLVCTKQWEILHAFRNEMGEVQALALHPDGLRAFVAGRESGIEEWFLGGELTMLRIPGDEEWDEGVYSLAVHANGRFAFGGTMGGRLLCWDLEARRFLDGYSAHYRLTSVHCIALASHAPFALSGNDRGVLVISDLRGQTDWRDFREHEDGPVVAAIAPDGTWGVSGGSDGRVKIWDFQIEPNDRGRVGHGRGVYSLVVDQAGTIAVSASRDRMILWWDIDTGEQVGATMGTVLSFYCAAFDPRDPSGNTVLAGLPGAAQIWSTNGPTHFEAGDEGEEGEYGGHEENVFAIATHASTLLAATGDTKGGLRVWNLRSNHLLFELRGHEDMLFSLAFDEFAQRLASCDSQGIVRIWDMGTGESLYSWKAHEGVAFEVVFVPNRPILATVGSDGVIALWNTTDFQCIRRIQAHDGSGMALCATFDGKRLVSGGSDDRVKLWDLDTGQLLGAWQAEAGIYAVAVGRSGRIICGDATGRIEFLDWIGPGFSPRMTIPTDSKPADEPKR